MKDIMEVARAVKSLDRDEASKEIFELVKADKGWLSDIVKLYVDNIVDDVVGIKNLVHEYQNPVTFDEEEKKNLN